MLLAVAAAVPTRSPGNAAGWSRRCCSRRRAISCWRFRGGSRPSCSGWPRSCSRICASWARWSRWRADRRPAGGRGGGGRGVCGAAGVVLAAAVRRGDGGPVTRLHAVFGAMVCAALMARLPTPWTALGAVCFAVSDAMIGISEFVRARPRRWRCRSGGPMPRAGADHRGVLLRSHVGPLCYTCGVTTHAAGRRARTRSCGCCRCCPCRTWTASSTTWSPPSSPTTRSPGCGYGCGSTAGWSTRSSWSAARTPTTSASWAGWTGWSPPSRCSRRIAATGRRGRGALRGYPCRRAAAGRAAATCQRRDAKPRRSRHVRSSRRRRRRVGGVPPRRAVPGRAHRGTGRPRGMAGAAR